MAKSIPNGRADTIDAETVPAADLRPAERKETLRRFVRYALEMTAAPADGPHKRAARPQKP